VGDLKGKAMNEKKLNELGTAARAAGEAYDAQGKAFEDEHAAEVALLIKVVELVRPGLASICSKIDGMNVPAVKIGAGLWMDASGFLEWSGPGTVAPRGLTSTEVIEGWSMEEVVADLVSRFNAQIKGRGPSIKAARERAEKLRSIAKLLG
jgi:hypothetical protein